MQARLFVEVKEKTRYSFLKSTLAYIVEYEHGRKKIDADDEDNSFRESLLERKISQKARETINADGEYEDKGKEIEEEERDEDQDKDENDELEGEDDD